MKKILMSFCAIAMMFGATSCSDFLTEDPKGQLAQDNFFTSQSDLDMAVNALYNKVQACSVNTNIPSPAWQGDDVTTHPASNKQPYADFCKFCPGGSDKTIRDCWNDWWIVVKAANYIILNADKTPVSETEIGIAKGQAYYWRAVAYFFLVRTFGDIPMNLENEIDVTVTPTAVAEVYKQIESDMEAALKVLPTSYSSSPRQWQGVAAWVTYQAAKATQASIYLTEAGWPQNFGTAYYTKAAAAAKEVIDGVNSGKYEYKLNADYADVYKLSNNYNLETVVGVNHSNDFTWGQDTEMGVSNIFESQGGWGDAWGTYTFWKNFPEGARKEATFMPKIRVLVGGHKGALVNFWEKDGDGAFYITEAHPAYQIYCASADGKGDFDYLYSDGKYAAGNACTSQRCHYIRYSEVLCWYAEASARATGSIDNLALECLNKVRVRAGETAATAADFANAEAFADAAYDEHGWEVAGYFTSMNCRRYDVQRMHRFDKVWAQRQADKTNGVEVAPGVVLKEDHAPEGTYSDSKVYAPYYTPDIDINSNLQ